MQFCSKYSPPNLAIKHVPDLARTGYLFLPAREQHHFYKDSSSCKFSIYIIESFWKMWLYPFNMLNPCRAVSVPPESNIKSKYLEFDQ